MPERYEDVIEAMRRAIQSITDPKKKKQLIDAVERLRKYLNNELRKLAKRADVEPWVDIPSWVELKDE